mmetsp:Transcript_55194/g.162251  ORF Transcript_55194/g.162251 Transcript_55194/m.162251 type:complete len:480 (-) Transcript_55194:163-1602(-)
MAAATEAAMQDAQMQQMQAAMLAMTQGMAGTMPTMPDPSLGLGGVPPMDPALAQGYMQQMFQYLQQAAATQSPGLGMPGLGFPGMSPYAPTMPSEPAIAVSVEGMKFQYQLTDDDLHKVFSRYGSVKQIHVDEAGAAAQIVFHNVNEAQSAMNDLNGKVLQGLDGTLRISWISNPLAPPAPYPSLPGIPFGAGGWGMPPTAPAWPGMPDISSSTVPGVAVPTGVGAMGMGMGAGDKVAHQKGVRKYTCRFLIGIENDKDFQVARRLIGSKGSNMKRIVRTTEAKLRLRGVGSGYFEGAGQKESSEPLQLCVSCVSQEGYKAAVRQVEELLLRVYEDNRQFCRENNMPAPDLAINLSENPLVYSLSKGGGGGGGMMGGGGGGMEASPKRQAKRGGAKSRGGRGGATGGSEGDRGEPGPNAPPVDEIETFISERNEARRACNFAEADRIRESLHSRGVALMDEPGGRGRGAEVTTWRYWRD